MLTGNVFSYVVRPQDTLSIIGARFGVPVSTLIVLNHLQQPNRLVVDQTLVVDNRHLASFESSNPLLINVAQRMLYLAHADGVEAYPIAVGRPDWPTPLGPFSIRSKETNPAWDVPISIQEEMRRRGQPVVTRVPPSPDNPLGQHWIGLSLSSLGLHGTNAPSSIYRYASHGCIRLLPANVADLFQRVSIGMSGVIVYEPVQAALIDGRVFVEAHRDVYRRASDAMSVVRARAERDGFGALADWQRIGEVVRQRLGIAVDVTREPTAPNTSVK